MATCVMFLIIMGCWTVLKVDNSEESVVEKCKEYGMTYVYRNGAQYCLDSDNILHPIYYECDTDFLEVECTIRFIKGVVGDENDKR